MRTIFLLSCIFGSLSLVSCLDTGPGHYQQPNPYGGYNNSYGGHQGGYRQNPQPYGGGYGQSQTYSQGYQFGFNDARAGRDTNWMQYNNYYDSSTKKDFGNGYLAGHRAGR